MSLLMDALRRAEEAKRTNHLADRPETVASSPELRLDPLETSPPRNHALPPLVDDPDGADTDLTFDLQTPPPAPSTAKVNAAQNRDEARQTAERLAVKNVFSAKETPRRYNPLWLFLGFAGVAAVAIGGYFWWQLENMSKGGSLAQSTTAAAPKPAIPATNPATNPAASVSPGPSAVPAPRPEPMTTAEIATAAQTAMPKAEASGVRLSPPTATQPRIPTRESRLNRRPPRAYPAEEGLAGTSILRPGNRRTPTDHTLHLAYEAWLADRLDDSRRAYEHVLRGDPRNTDALLGLAAIASRQGQNDRAQHLYQRVLDADPNEPTAQAALINLRAQNNDGGQSESRLRTLLVNQPDSPSLHFALGNLYARQSRWKEAQQAFFQSYALEPDNADYIFNVAVSLDHLRQPKLAAQYYRMALSAAETRHGTFDKNAIARRVAELQP
ncbi:MAG TPA: tetratricopeptide repeat protein [Accumulibacter sp.]|nr:tetratricopeptide repeat protein [Accumulibacter sp.]